MTVVLRIVVVALAGWLAAALVGRSMARDVFFGMAGPLAAVVGSWLLVERTHRANPAGVTSVLVAAFAAKMIFFGVYVAMVLGLAGVRRVPFILSFTVYFVGLYATEAVLMRRLFSRVAP